MDSKMDRSAAKLAGALVYKTVSYPEQREIDFSQFEKLQAYYETVYPALHRKFKKERIGEAGLLYTWLPENPVDEPLLIMAHQDVVSAGEEKKWKYGPFDGIVAEGYIWGRGAIDCKGHIAAQMEALERLIEDGFAPKVGICLYYGYNEEVQGDATVSSAWLAAEEIKNRGMRFSGIIDEGGGMRVGDSLGITQGICSVMLGEKGYMDVELISHRPGGHSARPYRFGALYDIACAIKEIEENPLPYRVIDVIKKRFSILSSYVSKCNPDKGRLFADVSLCINELDQLLDNDPENAALFHTTIVPTMASAAVQPNIIPETARVVLNCRLLPGDTIESVLSYIKSIVPKNIEVNLIYGVEASPLSIYEGRLKNDLVESCREIYGEDIVAVPDILVAGTDAKYMYELSKRVYRFSPFFKRIKVPAAHEINECLGVETLEKGVEFYCAFLKKYCTYEK